MTRRPHRPALRPLPGRYLTWENTALAVKPTDPARLAEALAASGYRAYRVGVYLLFEAKGHRFLGYVATSPHGIVGDGYGCVHTVHAKGRDAARRMAVKEHKEQHVPDELR